MTGSEIKKEALPLTLASWSMPLCTSSGVKCKAALHSRDRVTRVRLFWRKLLFVCVGFQGDELGK